jgi:hypothetical protein
MILKIKSVVFFSIAVLICLVDSVSASGEECDFLDSENFSKTQIRDSVGIKIFFADSDSVLGHNINDYPSGFRYRKYWHKSMWDSLYALDTIPSLNIFTCPKILYPHIDSVLSTKKSEIENSLQRLPKTKKIKLLLIWMDFNKRPNNDDIYWKKRQRFGGT